MFCLVTRRSSPTCYNEPMKIAILSDSHDHLDNLRAAIAQCEERGLTQGIHLGDFCAPFAVRLLSESKLNWIGVWGNVDGDRLKNTDRAGANVDIGMSDFREVELDGKKIFLTHYDQIGRIAALSGQYDAVFHGHNHIAAQEVIENNGKQTLLANPGEICGWRFGKPSFAVYDTENNAVEHIWL